MSNIAEHYSRARHTSNLKSEPRTRMSASDVLTAAGMSAQENAAALMLWDIAFRGKTGAKLALADLLEKRAFGHMARCRMPGDSRDIARAALAWYLSQCQSCGGEGHEIVPHTITRSDELCPVCHGSGKLQQPDSEAFRWMADEIGRLMSIAAGSVMNKLNRSMEL